MGTKRLVDNNFYMILRVKKIPTPSIEKNLMSMWALLKSPYSCVANVECTLWKQLLFYPNETYSTPARNHSHFNRVEKVMKNFWVQNKHPKCQVSLDLM